MSRLFNSLAAILPSADAIKKRKMAAFAGDCIAAEDEKIKISIDREHKTLTISDILQYIRIYEPFDKAGSYGIQDGFSVHIDKINGCYYNVMGLPISKFYSYYSDILANQ